MVQFSSVQSLSRVRLFATPWIAARQASLSITNSRSSLKLRFIKSVMPSSHLILCRPLLLLSPIPPSIRIFSSESTLRMRWPKYWSFSFSIIPSKEIPGLGYGFSCGHVWMWELDCEEGRALKNWCFWTVVLEKTLESPLDCKEIQPVHSEGDQPWDFFGRNDAKAETPVLWPPHAKRWLIGKDSDAGRDWGQEEKGTTEDEMAGWHHGLDGRESEWTLGVGDGQGGLACCNSWGRKELDTTEWLNWTEGILALLFIVFYTVF